MRAIPPAGWPSLNPPECDTGPYLNKIIEATENRLTVAGDILDYDDFFTEDQSLTYDEKAFQKRLVNPEGAVEILTESVTVWPL